MTESGYRTRLIINGPSLDNANAKDVRDLKERLVEQLPSMGPIALGASVRIETTPIALKPEFETPEGCFSISDLSSIAIQQGMSIGPGTLSNVWNKFVKRASHEIAYPETIYKRHVQGNWSDRAYAEPAIFDRLYEDGVEVFTDIGRGPLTKDTSGEFHYCGFHSKSGRIIQLIRTDQSVENFQVYGRGFEEDGVFIDIKAFLQAVDEGWLEELSEEDHTTVRRNDGNGPAFKAIFYAAASHFAEEQSASK
jgi:hypothetical protein